MRCIEISIQNGEHGVIVWLIETWDVLKWRNFNDALFISGWLIETWDVLKWGNYNDALFISGD